MAASQDNADQHGKKGSHALDYTFVAARPVCGCWVLGAGARQRATGRRLCHERPYLFTFFDCPGLVHAANSLAERVMRILAMIRKNWGGNLSENGTRAQAILTPVCYAPPGSRTSRVLDANDTDGREASHTNVGGAEAHRLSGRDQRIPLPACVDVEVKASSSRPR